MGGGRGVAPRIMGVGLIFSEPPKPVKCLSFGNFLTFGVS